MNKTIIIFFFLALVISCGNKKSAFRENLSETKDTISGFYKTEDDPNIVGICNLSLTITKSKKRYFYHLITDSRNVKGKVSIDNENPNEPYIILEGIEWDEYEGDVSNQLDENESEENAEKLNLKIPVGIDAYVGRDTLTIQNYGNSMNYYTKFGECDRKYIFLIKQKNHR